VVYLPIVPTPLMSMVVIYKSDPDTAMEPA
jgi:hypothetical protein